MQIAQNRITKNSMTISKPVIPVSRTIIRTPVRRCGGGAVPLITTPAITSYASGRTAPTATVTLTIRRVCGPAFPSNPPQDDPAPIPPPQGGGRDGPNKTGPTGPEHERRVSARENFEIWPFRWFRQNAIT